MVDCTHCDPELLVAIVRSIVVEVVELVKRLPALGECATTTPAETNYHLGGCDDNLRLVTMWRD